MYYTIANLELRFLKTFSWIKSITFVGGYTPETAEVVLNDNKADAIMSGRWFIANPHLPERITKKADLNKYDRATFYSDDEKGYINCFFLS